MANLRYLVIHCTATPEGREVTSDTIRKWHTSPPPDGRGWKQVGYTDMIHINGGVERLVDNNEDSVVDGFEITNGVAGYNSLSRNIVYVGGLTKDAKKSKDTRTSFQINSLKKYVIDFIRKNPEAKVAGHYQFAPKDCPSFDVVQWCKSIGISDKNIYQK